ncbi:hypothetical protein [Streptomyces sp. CG 926]|nr:hypothetical protein [Streptomyces sp. CG 926]
MAETAEYRAHLHANLTEEVREIQEAAATTAPAELADLMEVVYDGLHGA